MSDERFSFLYDFQVNDQRLQGATQRLEHFNAALDRSRVSLGAFEQAAARGAGGLDQRLRQSSSSAVDLAAKLSLVSSALSVVQRMTVGAVEAMNRYGDTAIAAFGERAGTIRGYTQLLGSKSQANLEFYRGQQFAQRTDFTSEVVEQGQARLLAQGFRGKDLYSTLFSAADLAAMTPGSQEKKNETLSRILMAESQIKAKGRLQGEELTQQLAEAGLNTQLVFEQLKKPLGVKTSAAVQKKISAGEVSADIALPAIQRAILQQLGTTKAGEYATGAAGSLSGLISNRDEAFKNLLKGFDADEALPGINRYKAALKEQGAVFDVNTKAGKNLSLVLQDLANTSIEAKSGWTEFTSSFLDSFSESYVRRLNQDGRDFNSDFATGALKNLGEAIGHLGTIAARAAGGVGGLTGNVAQRAANAINANVGFWDAVQSGDAAGAAKGLGKFLWDYTPQGFILRSTPAARGLSAAYDKGRAALEMGDILDSNERFDFGADAAARASRDLAKAKGPKIAQEDRATQMARRLEAKKKAGNDPAWNHPLWWYETDSMQRGASVEARAAINAASVEAAIGSRNGGSVQNQTNHITINIASQPGQSPTDIARAVHIELATQLRQLPRAPRNR